MFAHTGLLGTNMFSKSGDSYSGPLLSAMQTFGNGVEEGLTSVETAVKAYNTSQVQDTVDAFEKQFCKDAKYEAPEKTPLNFTGRSPHILCWMQPHHVLHPLP